MTKKIFSFFALIISVFSLASCSGDNFGYKELPKKNNFVEINIEKFTEIADDTTDEYFVVYYGYPGCSACLATVKGLNEAAVDQDITINYFPAAKADGDAWKSTWNSETEKTTLINKLRAYDKDSDGNYVLFSSTPQVLIIKKGELVEMKEATTSKEDYISFFEDNLG